MAKSLEEFMENRKRNAKTQKNSYKGSSSQSSGYPAGDGFDAVLKQLLIHTESISLAKIDSLYPYTANPFKLYGEAKMNALMESIRRDGLQQSVIVRDVDGIKGYEILSGHNRVEAMRRLGRSEVPVIHRDLTDEQAAMVVATTNLEQRARQTHERKLRRLT